MMKVKHPSHQIERQIVEGVAEQKERRRLEKGVVVRAESEVSFRFLGFQAGRTLTISVNDERDQLKKMRGMAIEIIG